MRLEGVAASVYVQDRSGQTVLHHRPDEPHNPASIAKLMTALVALPLIAQYEELTVVDTDLRGGSGNNLQTGDSLSFEDALYNLFLPSSNTSARTIARTAGARIVGPGQPISSFIAVMNYEAAKAGLTSTHFANPHGLFHPTMKSTARDVARLVQLANEESLITSIWGNRHHALDVRGSAARTMSVESTVPALDARVIGAKTGTRRASTYNLACSLKGGLSVAILGASSNVDRYKTLDTILTRLSETTPTLPGRIRDAVRKSAFTRGRRISNPS